MDLRIQSGDLFWNLIVHDQKNTPKNTKLSPFINYKKNSSPKIDTTSSYYSLPPLSHVVITSWGTFWENVFTRPVMDETIVPVNPVVGNRRWEHQGSNRVLCLESVSSLLFSLFFFASSDTHTLLACCAGVFAQIFRLCHANAFLRFLKIHFLCRSLCIPCSSSSL